MALVADNRHLVSGQIIAIADENGGMHRAKVLRSSPRMVDIEFLDESARGKRFESPAHGSFRASSLVGWSFSASDGVMHVGDAAAASAELDVRIAALKAELEALEKASVVTNVAMQSTTFKRGDIVPAGTYWMRVDLPSDCVVDSDGDIKTSVGWRKVIRDDFFKVAARQKLTSVTQGQRVIVIAEDGTELEAIAQSSGIAPRLRFVNCGDAKVVRTGTSETFENSGDNDWWYFKLLDEDVKVYSV